MAGPFSPPDWRIGRKITGADLDGTLDAFSTATTGITAAQIDPASRYPLDLFAINAAGFYVNLNGRSAARTFAYATITVPIPAGGATYLGVQMTANIRGGAGGGAGSFKVLRNGVDITANVPTVCGPTDTIEVRANTDTVGSAHFKARLL